MNREQYVIHVQMRKVRYVIGTHESGINQRKQWIKDRKKDLKKLQKEFDSLG